MVTRPFTIDPVLTAVAVNYRNTAQMMIADEVLPRVPVGAEKFKWTEYPIGQAFSVPDARVGRLGQVQQLTFSGTERTDEVIDYGLDSPIPNSDLMAAEEARNRGVSMANPELLATQVLTDTVANIREVRVAQLIHASATYDAARRVTLSGTSQFSDAANSDPITVINTAMDGTLLYRPNVMVMGKAVWSKLKSHPKIVNAVKGNVTDSGNVTREQFAELFSDLGPMRVLVGDAQYNTAKPGQAATLASAWGKHIALLHINPVANTQAGISFGMTAQYGGRIAGRIMDPDIGLQGGFRIRSGERLKEIIVAKDLGYLIINAVA
jgi:hypothetical protein